MNQGHRCVRNAFVSIVHAQAREREPEKEALLFSDGQARRALGAARMFEATLFAREARAKLGRERPASIALRAARTQRLACSIGAACGVVGKQALAAFICRRAHGRTTHAQGRVRAAGIGAPCALTQYGQPREQLDDGASGLKIVQERIDNAGLQRVMSNSFGFGGTNATLIFQRMAEA